MDPAAELLVEDQPLLAGLAATSIHSRIATGRRAGQEVPRRGDRIEDMEEGAARADRVAGGGFSLHAGVAVPARDRKRLERLCRYVARLPVATERLSREADTRLLYRLKRCWRDGTTHMVFEAGEMLEKLVSLVPPPRAHQVRYHGVLAPCAARRAQVVPRVAEAPRLPKAIPTQEARDLTAAEFSASVSAREGHGGSTPEPPEGPEQARRPGPPGRPRRLPCAELMRRVFAVDVLECPNCGGRTRAATTSTSPRAAPITWTSRLPSAGPAGRSALRRHHGQQPEGVLLFIAAPDHRAASRIGAG